ncbi:ROK family transcriptional regulator [Bifidobacterium pullorum]|uniref:NagC/XylR-type transciptional regulator n=1 Tax=Bifidobacterium pullorum subsp. saeculare DSM 6531 = LMG 14934 TaxID=1437611 RepID=A0A087D070_9BIFI|nr:ROK family transcriptional regulator [Bifidobacterium pullorum]KFI88920.1 NagC/XylR-type transciptional regulator [Bifidobacterium pullorum subsp. saeculare DSM 6531 = LMG 14934]MBE5065737.1 ROK family transcriptional regulator [Bifidobacterium pullorum subsp. saeculare]HJE21613.1 ROK family transcriptional regulator [Bifidobacterium pullorum]
MAALRRINQDDLRNHNLSVVIDTLLRTTEPLSRAELAKRTGLTKATMSLLVSMLVDDGVVREGEPSVQSSYGRPSTPLLIAGGRYCGIGLQVNTDGYGVIVLDLDGTVISERWVDADMSAPDADEVFAELDALAMEQEALLAERGCTVAGAGLALPGLVTGNMRLLMARNLGWEQLDLTRFDVMRRLDVTAGNEANMAALAQIPGYAMRRDGDGIVGPSESFIYLSTDVGIGGAVVRNGHVEIGDHGFGGELGHTSVELRGPVCRCGRRGCLETYAGRRAMVESAGIASGSAAARRESVDELIDRWCAGDVRVAAVVNKAIEAMVSSIASAINVCDIETVVLGGVWSQFGSEIAVQMQSALQRQVLGYPEVRAKVLMADVTSRPALVGAAAMGLRHFVDDPMRFVSA